MRLAMVLLAVVTLAAASRSAAELEDTLSVASPDGRTRVTIAVPNGHLVWSATRDGRPVVNNSRNCKAHASLERNCLSKCLAEKSDTCSLRRVGTRTPARP